MRALWWWIDRWRKSTAYTDMTLEEQGAYRNLLDEANLRGGALPNDERILAKACGDALAWSRVRDNVMARFELRSDGWHPRNEVSLYVSRHRRQPPLVPLYRRPEIPRAIQRAVRERDQGRCRLCGSDRRLEFDHEERWRDGGRHTIENLRLLCLPCNRGRG